MPSMQDSVRTLAALFLATMALEVDVQAQSHRPGADSLSRDAQGKLIIRRDEATGAVTFVRGGAGVPSGIDRARLDTDPAAAALAFLARHEAALGLPRLQQERRTAALPTRCPRTRKKSAQAPTSRTRNTHPTDGRASSEQRSDNEPT